MGLWLATVAVGLGAGRLAAANGLDLSRALTEFLVAQVTAAVSFATVGAVIAARRPAHRMGWALSLIGLAAVLPALTTQYARYALVTEPGSLPGGTAAAWLTQWIWIPSLVAFVVGVPLLFPDVRLPDRPARYVGAVALSGSGLTALGRAVGPGPDPGLPEVANPLAVSGLGDMAAAVEAAGWLLLLVSVLGTVGVVVRRFRRSAGRERRQLKWFLYALAVIVAAEVAAPLAILLLHGEVPPEVTAVTETAMAPWLAIAIGVAIMRHRLYDIDLAIHRTLVYGGLTAAVIGLYVLVVGYFGAMLDLRGEPVSLLAAALVAVVFAPLRARLQVLATRLVYGRREEPYTVLSDLGRRLEQSPEHRLAPETVLATLVTAVRDALKLRHAEIRLAGSGGQASTGRRTGAPLQLPLTFGQEPVGELLVSPRGPGETFSTADRRLLDDFARHAAVAAHAVVLTADVQRARTRVVTAREEERRRIRRELHDGLGTQLASQMLALDAARGLIDSDPAAADGLLVELREQTREAVSGIRRLVYDLRPPVLDDRGLAAALEEQVPRFAGNGLTVDTDIVAKLPPLSAALDVAAYRIALEALTNVVRHARATRCDLRLEVVGDDLVLEVTDDGAGLPEPVSAGVGLASIRERAAELGGTALFRRGPRGGTTVRAQLPLQIGS